MNPTLKTLSSHAVLGIGAGLTALAMIATYKAGRSMDVTDVWASFFLGCMCALISAGVAMGLHIVDRHKAEGDAVAAKTWQRLWYAMLVFEICSAALFTVGHRAANVNQAIAQDAKFQAAGVIASDKRKSLDDLRGELEAFQVANPWSLTTEAGGLQADLDVAEQKVEVEAARGGCKSECLKRMAEAKDIKVRIGALAKRNELTAKMDALKTKVEETATAAVTAERGDSAVAEASLMFARFGSLSLEPGKEAVGWATNISGLVMSVIFSIAAAMFMREGLREYLPHTAGYTPDIGTPASEPDRPVQPVSAPSAPQVAPVAFPQPAPAPEAIPSNVLHTIRAVMGAISPVTPAVANVRTFKMAA